MELTVETILSELGYGALHVQTKQSLANKILSACAAAFGITVKELVSRSQNRQIAQPRQLAIYLLVKSNYNYHEVADIIHRHRTTIYDALMTMENDWQSGKEYRSKVTPVLEMFGIEPPATPLQTRKISR